MIQLPPDLFFGTTIATCVIVLKKSKADNKTLFIDASAQFVRGGTKNKLTADNQQAVLDAFVQRGDADHFARLVDNSEIAENDYNLSVSSYVEEQDTREAVGVFELNAEIARIVERQQELRTAIDEIVADLEAADRLRGRPALWSGTGWQDLDMFDFSHAVRYSACRAMDRTRSGRGHGCLNADHDGGPES